MQELRDFVETNPVWLIRCKDTHRIYIDINRCAYLFFSKEGAEGFTAEIENTEAGDKEWTSVRNISSACYACGADKIKTVMKDTNSSMEFDIERPDLLQGYYNSDLEGYSRLLKQTQKKSFIKKFSDCTFIVPIRIINQPELKISYATVTFKNGNMMYVAFSTLEEYRKWEDKVNEKAGSGWQPLEVTYDGLKRVCSKHGFLLNPFGIQIMVTRELMRLIPSHDASDDEEDF